MSRRGNTAGTILSAATFILLEVAALAMLRSSSSLQDVWINRISHRCLGVLWGGSDRILSYFSLRNENDALAEKNLELTARNLRLEEIVREQLALNSGTAPAPGFSYIQAMVVKISTKGPRNYFILNKGSMDGVSSHCGVITPDGVIGIIEAVDKHYCYGLSLLNTDINISARIGRSGDTGALCWNGLDKETAILGGLDLHTSCAPGDTIWTSGYSSLFPPEIPLGTAGESRTVDGTSTQVTVHLFQNFNAIRFVTIVRNIGAEEIYSLERKEGRGDA